MSSSKKSKKDSSSKKSGKSDKSAKHKQDSSSGSGTDAAAVLNRAKLPVAAAGAVLVSVAGAATIRNSRHSKSRKSRLLRKAVKNPSPLVVLAKGGTRSLKKLAPGS
jgi:hypothetical protein